MDNTFFMKLLLAILAFTSGYLLIRESKLNKHEIECVEELSDNLWKKECKRRGDLLDKMIAEAREIKEEVRRLKQEYLERI